jgi:hypothetical protein
MWQLQNKLLEQWFDLCVYYSLFGYYCPLMMYGDLDEYVKSVSLNGVKKTC